MSDFAKDICVLISKQAAIDGLDSHYVERINLNDWQAGWNAALDWIGTVYLEELPSAQPEIIYCGDCKYKDDGIDEDGIPFLKCLSGRSYGGTRINDFCSWAERKEDG